MRKIRRHAIALIAMAALAVSLKATARAQVAGTSGANDLVIAQNGATQATVVVRGGAGTWERNAAADLAKYIGLMSGATPQVSEVVPAGNAPVFIVGEAALTMEPKLRDDLGKVIKQNPVLRADGIVVRRNGNRVYLAGSNDESHYFAVSWLLQQWGCRWYLPTDFGEVVPQHSVLRVGALNFVYAPPFEIRHYWLSWNGDTTGAEEFKHRNFMNDTSMVGMGHNLGTFTKDIAPGGDVFKVPFSDPKTAEHVAAAIEKDYAAGKDISLAIEDGNFINDSASDKALQFEYDRYTLKPSMTDAMLTLYNNVGRILHQKYPNSKAHIGGMAYANVTLPPKKVTTIEPNVVMWIAPIDIDPNHGMNDPKSLPRQEYRAMMETWAKLVGGRLAIYDYDQGMLVWRDMPNPAQQAFATDVKYYRDAGILGIGTESRGAMATVFLNLFFRGQLMWNPDADVNALLAEFYPKFYGPAAKPMAAYWNAIFDAWKNTVVTEHEYMAAPAIYTPELVAQLGKDLAQAEAATNNAPASRDLEKYKARMQFTRLSYDIIQNYMGMVTAAATEVDYKKATDLGAKALASRLTLAKINPTFTTHVVGPGEESEANGPAWFPGEVAQYRELGTLTDGTKGTLIAKTPLEWAWKNEGPVPAGWTYTGMEGGTPQDKSFATQPATDANGWKMLRTDVYLQGQGIHNPDGQSYTGHYWYQTTVDLKADQTQGKVHLMFPGMFNEAWLYVNGELVGHRDWSEPWWLTDYKFQWDADITGKLKPGKNVIAVRGFNPHHFGGIFRRPFLYRANG